MNLNEIKGIGAKELIILGLLSLEQMKVLLVKEDYWKVHKAYKKALKNRY